MAAIWFSLRLSDLSLQSLAMESGIAAIRLELSSRILRLLHSNTSGGISVRPKQQRSNLGLFSRFALAIRLEASLVLLFDSIELFEVNYLRLFSKSLKIRRYSSVQLVGSAKPWSSTG